MTQKQLSTSSSDASILESPVLLPAILIRNGRQQFRKEFINTYPSFIHTLRNAIPCITAGEEMLCMLIHLKQSTNDIAAILGIGRKSVNQARYRLRLKARLAEILTLEDYIKHLTND